MSINEIKSTNNVKYEFKILYALGIIFIVMGHCSHGSGISVFNEFFPFYSYHLALFMFISGYFYNSYNENFSKDFIIKKTKKLILPLYLWNVFYAFIMHILKNFGFFPNIHVNLQTLFIEPIMHGHQFVLNLGGWFVIPLYMIHIINILIRKVCSNYKIKINEFVYFGIALLLGFAGIFMASKGLNKGWYLVLDRVLYFLPFYSLGILYRKYERYDNISNLLYFGIIFSLALIIIYKYGSMPEYYPSWASFGTSNIIKPFYVSILGIAFWLRISKILSPAIGKTKSINIIADSTYTIMINHLLGFKIVNTLFAIFYKYTNLCAGFDINAYKTIWNYCYYPHALRQFGIIYVIGGIIFPIMLQKLIKKFVSMSLCKASQ